MLPVHVWLGAWMRHFFVNGGFMISRIIGVSLWVLLVGVLLSVALSAPFALAQATAAPTLNFTWVLPTVRESVDGAPGVAITPAELSAVTLYDVTAGTTKELRVELATWPVGTAGSFVNTRGGVRRYAITVTPRQGLESSLSNVVELDMRRVGPASRLQVTVKFAVQ